MNFGDRLKHAREEIARLTQKQLEDLTGVSQKTISKLERGDQEGSTAVVQLAIACGVRPEWLAMAQGEAVAQPASASLPPMGDAHAQGAIGARPPQAPSPLVAAAMRLDTAPHVTQGTRDAVVVLLDALAQPR